MAVAGLRGMVEKVGRSRTGFNNHHIHGVKRTMLLGFFGAVNPVNVNTYQHHLLSRRSYATHGRRFYPFPTEPPLEESEVRDNWYENQRTLTGIKIAVENLTSLHYEFRKEVLSALLIRMDNADIMEPAIIAVEQHNKQENTNLEFVGVVEVYMFIKPAYGKMYKITLEAIDNGVKNTYNADIWRNAGVKYCAWELQSFSLAPVNETNLIDKQGTNEHAFASSSTSLERQTSCSLENAMAVLRNLPNVKAGDNIFLCGSKLFLEDINREMFLKGLQTDQERLAWLQWHLALNRGSQSKVDQS